MADYHPCPSCASANIKKVSFTWWGGVLGPGLISHVKCEDCGTKFNGKSGKSNTPAILIYTVVTFIIAFGLFFWISSL